MIITIITNIIVTIFSTIVQVFFWVTLVFAILEWKNTKKENTPLTMKFKEWGELLGDSAITTAILDRIMHRVEIIHLNEDSYRMKHRSSIFEKESVTN